MYALIEQTDYKKENGVGKIAFFDTLDEANINAADFWLRNQDLNIFVREIKDPKKRGFFDSKGLKAINTKDRE